MDLYGVPVHGGSLCSDGSAEAILRTGKQTVTGSGDMARSSVCLPGTLYQNGVKRPHKTTVCNVVVLSGPKCFPHA